MCTSEIKKTRLRYVVIDGLYIIFLISVKTGCLLEESLIRTLTNFKYNIPVF
jgi:hypothetical protein